MGELSGDGELERKKNFRGRKKKEEEAGEREREVRRDVEAGKVEVGGGLGR